jgi:small subunit ribosomal protein S20
MNVMPLTVARTLSKFIVLCGAAPWRPLVKTFDSPYDTALFPAKSGVYMANTASARKRARQSEKQRQHNTSLRSELRTAVKNVRKAIEAGDKAAAQGVLQSAASTIDRIADKNIIHKNKAARHKSRLSAAIKGMA